MASKLYPHILMLIALVTFLVPSSTVSFESTQIDYHNRLQLFIAVRSGNIKQAKKLIEAGYDVNYKKKDSSTLLHYAFTVDMAQLLIENGASLNEVNRAGATPLTNAIRNGRIEVAKYLVKKGANPNVNNGVTEPALAEALRLHQLKLGEFLIAHGADPNLKNNMFREHILFMAVENDQVEFAKMLIDHGADVYITNYRGETLLHKIESPELAEFLLERGLKDIINDHPKSNELLHNIKNEEVVKTQIRYGADVLGRDWAGNTPLHKVRNVRVAEILIDWGADPNARNSDGKTPLHTNYAPDIVEFLIKQDSDINALDSSEKTPLDTANKKRKKKNDNSCKKTNISETIEFLIANGAKKSAKIVRPSFPLHRAIEKKQLKKVHKLLSSYTRINRKDLLGNSALHKAIEKEENSITELLLGNGAAPCIKNYKGMTPLHLVAERGNLHFIKTFLEQGCNINCRNNRGETPLFLAVKNEHVKTVEYLLSKNADPKIGTAFRNITPLMIASGKCNIEIFDLLQRHGVSIHQKSYWVEHTPLKFAINKGCFDIADRLILLGSDIHETGLFSPPIHHLTRSNNIEGIRYLLDKGVSPDTPDEIGLTPIFIAESVEAVKILVVHGADIHREFLYGITPINYQLGINQNCEIAEYLYSQGAKLKERFSLLSITGKENYGCRTYLEKAGVEITLHTATASGDRSLMRKLIKKGADVNAIDSIGRKPIHYATFGGNKKIMKLLLKNDAHVDDRDENGRTPLFFLPVEWPCSKDNEKVNAVVDILLENGADINAKDHDGHTPLHVASGNAIEILIANGAYVNAISFEGNTPLHSAITDCGQLCQPNKKINLLLKHGADTSIRNIEGKTAYEHANSLGKFQIVEMLKAE